MKVGIYFSEGFRIDGFLLKNKIQIFRLFLPKFKQIVVGANFFYFLIQKLDDRFKNIYLDIRVVD